MTRLDHPENDWPKGFWWSCGIHSKPTVDFSPARNLRKAIKTESVDCLLHGNTYMRCQIDRSNIIKATKESWSEKRLHWQRVGQGHCQEALGTTWQNINDWSRASYSSYHRKYSLSLKYCMFSIPEILQYSLYREILYILHLWNTVHFLSLKYCIVFTPEISYILYPWNIVHFQSMKYCIFSIPERSYILYPWKNVYSLSLEILYILYPLKLCLFSIAWNIVYSLFREILYILYPLKYCVFLQQHSSNHSRVWHSWNMNIKSLLLCCYYSSLQCISWEKSFRFQKVAQVFTVSRDAKPLSETGTTCGLRFMAAKATYFTDMSRFMIYL